MTALRKSVSIPEELDREIRRQAKLQARSYSGVVQAYLTSEVALIPQPGEHVDPIAGMIQEQVTGLVVEGPAQPRKRATKTRTGMCPHRLPVEAHCRICDR